MSTATIDVGGKTMYLQEDKTYKAKPCPRVLANRASLAAGAPKPKRSKAYEPVVKENFTSALPATRIGIDPAFRKNGMGVCEISPSGAVTFPRFKGRGMVGLVRWIQHEAPDNVLVTIEDSNLQNATFDRSGSKRKSNRVSRNVGCNQAISATIVDFCVDRWGDKVVRAVSPQQKGAKWSEAIMKGIAKINKHELPVKHRQDDIDAYQLAVRD